MSTPIWPLLTLAIGLALLVAEVFLPSAGVIGLVAAGCLLLSLYQAFQGSTALGWRFAAAEAVLVPSALGLALHWMPRTPIGRRAFLRPPESEDLGPSRAGPGVDELVGRLGRALTPLRPSGMVDFDGRRLDGVAESGLIPPGVPVLAVRVRSGRVVVRDASGEAP